MLSNAEASRNMRKQFLLQLCTVYSCTMCTGNAQYSRLITVYCSDKCLLQFCCSAQHPYCFLSNVNITSHNNNSLLVHCSSKQCSAQYISSIFGSLLWYKMLLDAHYSLSPTPAALSPLLTISPCSTLFTTVHSLYGSVYSGIYSGVQKLSV